MPGKVGENITTMQRNLNRAIEVMDRADQQVNNMVCGLADVFNGIYR